MNDKQNFVLCCIDGSSVTEAVCDYSGAIGLGSSEELLNELTEIEQTRSRLLIKQGQLIDLTIMGAFSHNRFRDFLLGSFTAKMLAATNRPLLLLR